MVEGNYSRRHLPSGPVFKFTDRFKSPPGARNGPLLQDRRTPEPVRPENKNFFCDLQNIADNVEALSKQRGASRIALKSSRTFVFPAITFDST